MASITKRGDSYRITVSCGYDVTGKNHPFNDLEAGKRCKYQECIRKAWTRSDNNHKPICSRHRRSRQNSRRHARGYCMRFKP